MTITADKNKIGVRENFVEQTLYAVERVIVTGLRLDDKPVPCFNEGDDQDVVINSIPCFKIRQPNVVLNRARMSQDACRVIRKDTENYSGYITSNNIPYDIEVQIVSICADPVHDSLFLEYMMRVMQTHTHFDVYYANEKVDRLEVIWGEPFVNPLPQTFERTFFLTVWAWFESGDLSKVPLVSDVVLVDTNNREFSLAMLPE